MIRQVVRGVTLAVLTSSAISAQESDSTTAIPAVFDFPIPATLPLLQSEPLVAEAPHRFLYDLGSTGFPHGVSAYGLRPEQQSLTLDGVPFDDLLTGRPRFDLLPLELLGVLETATGQGQPVGMSAVLRPLPAPTARTELRYVTGQHGTQQIGATHAQDRRPGFVGEQGTLGLLAHVSGRDAGGYYGASDVGGFRALGRARLIRSSYVVEVVEMQQRQTVQARSGVDSFDPSASVSGLGTRRETVRNDLWATVQIEPTRFGSLAATGFWTVQRDRYATSDALFSQRSGRGSRLGGRFTYEVSRHNHELSATFSGWRASTVDGSALSDSTAETFAALRLGDVVAVGPLRFGARVGGVQYAGRTEATGTLSLDLPRAGLSASVSSAPLLRSRLERSGGFGIASDGEQVAPRLLLARAEVEREAGVLDVRLGSYLSQQHGLSTPMFDPAGTGAADSVGVRADRSTLTRLGAEAEIGWRQRRPRGVYAAIRGATQIGTAETALGDRLLDTLPVYWGEASIGWRATGLFDGVLDLDITAGGRYWPAFQSLDFHAPSALFALPALGAPPVPSSGTLYGSLSARVQKRASVFVLYQNVLGERAVNGSYVVPVFPITPHQASFGVFWTLLN